VKTPFSLSENQVKMRNHVKAKKNNRLGVFTQPLIFWKRGEIMRKIILLFFMVFILLFLMSCGKESETVHFNNAEYESSKQSELILSEEIIADEALQEVYAEETPVEDVDETTLLHPFATALMEYIEGYEGDVLAYLATLDDDGTMGVLTTRPTTRYRVWNDYDDSYDYAYGISGTLFYMQDDEVFQIDVSDRWLFVAGRYNRLMVRQYGHTHIVEIIYKLESDRLETSTRLEYFSDEYLSMLFDDDDIVAELATERDALAEYARERYGLIAQPPPNFGHMQNTEDQTAQILSMTINCVPSLATTTTACTE
jgi:hypothetical protein